jgi:hypothetical protein
MPFRIFCWTANVGSASRRSSYGVASTSTAIGQRIYGYRRSRQLLVQVTSSAGMNSRPLIPAGSDVSRGPLVTGVRVRVSDASPRGFSGRVTAVHPGALTVTRDDNGWRELVLLSRRRVTAVDQ